MAIANEYNNSISRFSFINVPPLEKCANRIVNGRTSVMIPLWLVQAAKIQDKRSMIETKLIFFFKIIRKKLNTANETQSASNASFPIMVDV